MLTEIQQLALLNALLANWGGIQVRLAPMSQLLASDLSKIAHRLVNASSPVELTHAVEELLKLTRGTAAHAYVEELVVRSALPDQPKGVHPLAEPAQTWLVTANTGAALAETMSDHLAATDLASVPVFFATNRQADPQSAERFCGEPSSDISYGLVPVTIPLARHATGKLETPHWWNRFEGSVAERAIVLGEFEAMKQGAFASALEATLAAVQAEELLIFLHGYNVTFEEAAMRAAQFAFDTKFLGVVVLFSWPSLGALSRYNGDEDRAAASGDSFAAFIKGLEGGPWQRVHVLAHSMGNRVMLLGLADNPRAAIPLNQLVFVAADVYVPVFADKFPKLQHAGKLPATSYVSKRDNALLLSDYLHKGDRVGLVRATPYVAPDLETIDATSVDRGLLGHSYFSGQQSLLTDIGLLLRQEFNPAERGLTNEGQYWAFAK